MCSIRGHSKTCEICNKDDIVAAQVISVAIRTVVVACVENIVKAKI